LIFGLSLDYEIFLPASMMVFEDGSYLRMVLQILLCQIDLGSFLMVAARMFVLAIFVQTATFSMMVIRTLGDEG
jgi:hypothetical protein